MTEKLQQKQYPADRVCAYPECTTKLSIYNSTELCSLHSGRKYYKLVDVAMPNKRGAK